MMDTVGSRKRVRGVSRRTISRRTERSTRRRIGPSTNPMKRSTPVHNKLENTWMKFNSQRLPATMAAIITAMAVSAHQRERQVMRHWDVSLDATANDGH